LSEYVECKGASMEDGMLKVDLVYNPPVEKKAKVIDIK
jgi:HSP20 family molecular chaperone IbpA